MNKLIDWIKVKWKIVLIVLLSLMFVSKCTSANNYKRKFHKAEARTEYVTDSLKYMFNNSAKCIDSLTLVIKERNAEINSLNKQLDIYIKQNNKLNEQNDRLNKTAKDLANKPVIVNIPVENKSEAE